MLAIHTKDVKSNKVIETVRNAKRIGEEHFNLFLKERFVEKSKSSYQPHQEDVPINLKYAREKKKVPTNKAKLHGLHQDCSLFSLLFYSMPILRRKSRRFLQI